MNKLTKLLSVFALAGAIGAGVAGAAGCVHKHTYEEKWTSGGADGHYHVATCHPDAHTDTVAHGTAGTDGKCPDCGYQLNTPDGPNNPTPSGEKLEVAANVTGLIIEGVGDTTVNLSPDKKSHDIAKASVKVYFATGASLTKGTEVPAANLVLTLKDPSGADCTDWTGLKKNGAYIVYANLKDAKLAAGSTFDEVSEITATETVTVNNAVVAGSLAVKAGATLEQLQDVDKISSTWTYEVTRANGDKEDVAVANVTVSGLNTMTCSGDEFENKTATLSCTIEGTAVTGSVAYKINKNNNVVSQTYSLNFSALTEEQENYIKNTQVEGTHLPLELQGGRFAVCSTKSGEIASHGKSFDGKYFAKRLKMNAASTASKCPRYIKVHVDGPATLVVYAYVNAGTEGNESDRKVAVYGAMSVTAENPTATFTQQVGTSQAGTEKKDTKHTFTITEAGDYYIVSETNGVCFTYIEFTQQVTAVGNEEITLEGTVEATSVSVTHTSGKSAHVALGTTFESIKSAYTVKVLGVNNATCASGESDVTGDAKVTFEVPDEFETTIGEKVITVKYDNGVSTTIKVYVESGVSGIYGMTSALNSNKSTQVAAGTPLNVKKSDIVNTLLGASENASAEVTDYTVTYDGNTIDDTDGYDFAISETPYVITVTATVGDGQSTDTITATFELTVSQLSSSPTQSFLMADKAENDTVAANGTITENNLFKAVALGDMTYFVGDSSKSSIAKGEVKFTGQDGNEKTASIGLRTAATTTAGDPTTEIEIIANEKINLRVYALFSNSSYNSNKTGKLNYKVTTGGTPGEVTSVATGSARITPNVITITLEAGQKLTIGSDQGSDKGHLYLFGIEATQVTEE